MIMQIRDAPMSSHHNVPSPASSCLCYYLCCPFLVPEGICSRLWRTHVYLIITDMSYTQKTGSLFTFLITILLTDNHTFILDLLEHSLDFSTYGSDHIYTF